MCNEQVTLEQIDKLRTQLMLMADEKGFTHMETIIMSQALDCLLNKYNKKRNDMILKGID